ncbi:hypothetical protein BDR26DRAFT_1006260 [Obelidium mucronatum]|nr:hypothetical protein BDR26DRAFT_1006260 [Obelidium mucronatum]
MPYKTALKEARAQLASIALLQNQITAELARVTAIVDTVLSAEGITVELPKTATELVLVLGTTDRYHYHDPMNKQTSVLPPESLSGDTIGDHLKLGVKWDSSDYIAESKKEIAEAQDQVRGVHAARFIQDESSNALEEENADSAGSITSPPPNHQMLGARRPTISRSYLRVRNEMLEKSARVTNKISPAISAAFPDLNVPRSSVTSDPNNNSRGKELWKKVPGTIVKKSDVISGLAVTALPDINTLKKSPPPELTPKFKIVPYNTWEARLHWFFLCPAFDEKGGYISISKYHTMDYRKHTFWEDGLNPMAILSVFFNLVFIGTYFTTLLLIPYQAAYFETIEDCSALSWSLMAIFLLDTILALFTPLKPPKQDTKFRVKRPSLKKWQASYARKHLLVDVITILPWEDMIGIPSIALPFSLIRMLRTMRLPRMMAHNPVFITLHLRIESIVGIGNILVRIIPVGMVVIVFLHFQACAGYYVAKITQFSTWDLQFDHWKLNSGGVEKATTQQRYVWMLFQSVGKTFPMTFKPQTDAEQIVQLIFILLGAILYAILVGLISSAAISYDASGRLYRQKIDELTEYLNWKNIDQHTKKKLLNYYEFKYRGQIFRRKESSCRHECFTATMGDGRDDIYLGKIANVLNPIYFIPGDYIVNQGEQATEMFFILTGKVNIVVNGNIVSSISDGSFFGEVALIANIPRTASVQAATTCNLYSLTARDFNDIILEFDDMKQRIDKIYEERMAKVRMEQAAGLLLQK